MKTRILTQRDVLHGGIPRRLVAGARKDPAWRPVRVTEKTVTIILAEPSGATSLTRFMFRWDGQGYKRQGEYLEVLADPAEPQEGKS